MFILKTIRRLVKRNIFVPITYYTIMSGSFTNYIIL